jgi:predicted PurR-regulated permease PerM
LVVNIAGNILRPRLVGRDTQMPDGLVLLGTVGLLVGPMIAALFLAVWELYRSEFRSLLVEPLEQESSEGSR